VRWGRLAVIVALGGLAIAIALGVRAYDYVENDPRFCTSCHLMGDAFAKWQTSVHREVGCHACHQQSMAESLDQLWKYVTLRPDRVAKHAEVDYTRCGACHLSRDPQWRQVADTAGHKVHFVRLGFECVGCHSKGVHKFVRPTDACGTCHAEQVKAQGMAALHCTSCHDFLATDHPLGDPRRRDCLACHERMQVSDERFAATAPMRFPCQKCHDPHRKPLPTVEDCLGCHHIRDFGLHAEAAHADCMSCHRPHLWRVEDRATCERCHTERGDHHPDLPCARCHDFTAKARPAPAHADSGVTS
jgi:nitrate/TMAO reductase-like tetraheme cytochrome c subunit